MSTYTWTEHEGPGLRWTLDAAPRYAVERRDDFEYAMLIDGHEVDSASSRGLACARLECVFEYETHGSELALARTRLRQARERLLDRFPHAARDGQLSSILEGLGDALGTGPELDVSAAQPRSTEPDIFTCQVTPDLAIVTDASQCIVAEVSDGTAGRVLRRVTVTNVDALIMALGQALTAQYTALAEAEKRRQAGPDEKRRAEGRLDRAEVVEWLIANVPTTRPAAASTATAIALGDEFYGVTYREGHWIVPVTPGSGD